LDVSFFRLETVTGRNYATEPVGITVGNESTGSLLVIKITDYEVGVPPFSLELHDYYGQTVVTEDSSFAQMLVPLNMQHDCKGNSGYIGGTIVSRFLNGEALFSNMEAFCAPGGELWLNGTSDLVSGYARLKLEFRSCEVGGNGCFIESIILFCFFVTVPQRMIVYDC
jgi:hypothetical protein